MRTTGIVRRMDDLGRVIIPKEIRRTAGLREGDSFEIFTDKVNDKVAIVFVRYEEKAEVHIEVSKLDKLLNDVESLRKEIYETAPYDVICGLDGIMETIQTLYPNE